jgi:hypothetical protein
MIETLQAIIRGALARLSQQLQHDLPPFIAALAILLVALVCARLARWMVRRAFKGIELDRWLRRSGISGIVNPSGTLRASRVAARTAYWGILLMGLLAALNALGTELTSRIVEQTVFLFPKLAGAAFILLAGMWLGQYLGRSALIWAVNEDLPAPRRIALAVRAFVVFVSIVVAADALNFAKGVFLAAFILVLGGASLAAALAIGLGMRESVRRHMDERAVAAGHEPERSMTADRSLWNHL